MTQTVTTEALWGQLNIGLRRFIQARVGNSFDVDDIMQDVFVKIHQKVPDLRDTARVNGWVYQIVRNAIVDYYRKERIEVQLPEGIPYEQAFDDGPTAEQEMARCLRGFIDGLDPKYAEALYHTEIDGMTQKELAAHLDISVSGAKSRVQRGRQQLRTALVDCCHYEFDRTGRMIHYHSREDCAEDGNC